MSHHVADETLITPTLLRRFELEASFEQADGRYYAIILRADGNVLVHHPFGPQLSPDQMMWAVDVLRKLNRELHHDGAWVIVFTHPHRPELTHVLQAPPSHWDYDRYCLIWLDVDGDPQFTVEWQAGESELLDFAEVLLAGIESTMAKCEGAWEVWHVHMRQMLALKPEQTYKRALGEVPASTRH